LERHLTVHKQADKSVERVIVAELATRLKLALDAFREAEGRLAALDDAGKRAAGDEWSGTVERVRSINSEISLVRRIVNISWLRAVGRSPLGG
jgi:hypothetical protein